MNDRATAPRRALNLFLVLLLAPLAAACANNAQPEQGGLAGSTVGGSFSLVDQDGKRVRDTDFNGRYRLIYFGFANCPDVCPVDLQLAAAGLRQFEQEDAERAAKVQPIFITVDPERDTPEVLKRYVANFHPRLIGLTGTEAEVKAAKDEYAVFGEKGEVQPGGGYNVNHLRALLLLGPEGEPIAIVPHDQGPEGVARELDRWVR